VFRREADALDDLLIAEGLANVFENNRLGQCADLV